MKTHRCNFDSVMPIKLYRSRTEISARTQFLAFRSQIWIDITEWWKHGESMQLLRRSESFTFTDLSVRQRSGFLSYGWPCATWQWGQWMHAARVCGQFYFQNARQVETTVSIGTFLSSATYFPSFVDLCMPITKLTVHNHLGPVAPKTVNANHPLNVNNHRPLGLPLACLHRGAC